MIQVLEYIGTAFVIVGQWVRSTPELTMTSLWITMIGSFIFIPYNILTGQWGYLALNTMSILANIRGLRAWRHKHVTSDKIKIR